MSDIPSHRRTYKAPGRLGDPRRELYYDPRVNVKLIHALAQYGVDRPRTLPSAGTAALGASSTMQQLGESMAEAEAGMEKLFAEIPLTTPYDTVELDIEQSERTIKGPDHRDLKLHVFRPRLRGGPLPCIVYLHGGAMTILRTTNAVHMRWCRSLAAQGMVVVAVDFRNAWTPEGFNPFPAGLSDCCAAIRWVHAHKDQLNVINIVVQGEDGGGNLALASALKAVREGWIPQIDGVYAISPCISAAYDWSDDRKLGELPSLVECNGYFVSVEHQASLARVYTPKTEDRTNALAWPYHASAKEMIDLPPHVLSMDELDPFRDEGMVYCRNLTAAGVKCVGHVNVGLSHGASVLFRHAVPAANRDAVRSVASFAKQC